MPFEPRRRSPRPLGAAAVACALAIAPAGCGTVKQTNTPRTGTEQLLLTNAWDRALQKVDFRPLTGVPVFLDTANVTAVDQGWVVSSLRQALLTQGVLLRQKPEQAQFIVEARVGAYGTDEYNVMIGIPQVTVPPTLTGVPTGTVPEMPIIKKSDQHAVAKLALFAFDRASGQLVWSSGTQVDTSNKKDTYIGGFGPIQRGSIREGTGIIGEPMPGAGPDPGGKKGWFGRRKSPAPVAAKSDVLAPMGPDRAPMAARSDLDSFRP